MTRNTRFATILLVAAIPLAVLAADPRPASTAGEADSQQQFKDLDKNHDGYIDRTEARKSGDVTTRFSTLDTNNDSRISESEWLAGEQSKTRGAAGMSGESREPGMAPGQSGETTKPRSNMY